MEGDGREIAHPALCEQEVAAIAAAEDGHAVIVCAARYLVVGDGQRRVQAADQLAARSLAGSVEACGGRRVEQIELHRTYRCRFART